MPDHNDIGSKSLSALKWGYGGALGRALSQLVIQMLLARLLGPESFGQAMAAALVLNIGWILAEGGFGTALIQKAQLKEADISYALGWVLLLSCSTGGLVVLGSHQLALWLGGAELQGLIMASGALIPVQAVANIPASLMRRNFDVRRSQLIFLSSYVLVYGGVGLPLAWGGAGAWSLVIAAGLQTLFNLVGNYVVVRHTLRPRLRGGDGLVAFGMQVTSANVMGWIAENTDRLLVNRFWGTAALGEFTAAASLSRAPAGLLVSAVQSVTLASASRLQDDSERLARSYIALLGVITLVTGPLATLMALHATTIVHLLYGERWPQTGPIFAAFCASLPAYAVLSVSGPVLWAINAVRQDLYTQIFGFVAVATGFYVLKELPLKYAVWLVPLVCLARAGLFYLALAPRLHLRHRRALRALRGAVVLTALAAGASLAFGLLLPGVAGMVVATVTTVLVALLTLRVWPNG